MTKVITAQGLKPEVLVQPSSLEFPKRIIANIGKITSTYQEISISFLGEKERKWYFDLSSIEVDSIFKLDPISGTLNQSDEPTIIKVNFFHYKKIFFLLLF